MNFRRAWRQLIGAYICGATAVAFGITTPVTAALYVNLAFWLACAWTAGRIALSARTGPIVRQFVTVELVLTWVYLAIVMYRLTHSGERMPGFLTETGTLAAPIAIHILWRGKTLAMHEHSVKQRSQAVGDLEAIEKSRKTLQ